MGWECECISAGNRAIKPFQSRGLLGEREQAVVATNGGAEDLGEDRRRHRDPR